MLVDSGVEFNLRLISALKIVEDDDAPSPR